MATDDVVTQFFINGAWTTVAGSVNLDERVRKSPGVEITRGTSDQQSSITASSSEFYVNNADGVFSNRNPTSPLYGLFPRYTGVRHLMPNAAGNLDSYVRFLRPDDSGVVSTTDKALVEVASDIDIRFDFTPDTWIPLNGQAICGKYATAGNQRSWIVWLNNVSQIVFRWSTDGTTTTQANFTPWPASRGYGRQIVRITLDTNNGAGGWTAVLMYGESITGPWTTVDTVTQAGTTTIFATGTAPLELGSIETGSPIAGHTQLFGKLHRFQLRNGIGATLVADMNASTHDVGETSWADGLGNTWTVGGTARVSSDRIRHTGEIDTIEHRWDTTRKNVWMPLKSQGALNRLQEDGSAVQSPIYNSLIRKSQITGYFPLEDASGSTRAGGTSADMGSICIDMTFTGSQPDGLAGSAGSVRINSIDSGMSLQWPGRTSTGDNTCLWFFKMGSSLPATTQTLFTIQSVGTVRFWTVGVGTGNYHFKGYDINGALIVDNNMGFGTGAAPNDQWIGMQLVLDQVGGNVNYTWRWFPVMGDVFYVNSIGGLTVAGTVGRFIKWTIGTGGESAFVGTEVAHVITTLSAFSLNSNTFRDMSRGYPGELSAVRAARVGSENDITLEVYGDPSDTQPMGVQPIGTPIDVLSECAEVDGAILSDLRDKFGLSFRTRVDLTNQYYNNNIVAYGSSVLSEVPNPVEDGRYTKNDITGSRPDGVKVRATQTEGPLSTLEPPNGIGFRPGSFSANAATDAQMQRLVEFQVWLRTRDEMRIPSLVFELHRRQIEANTGAVSLYERVIAMNQGDWFSLTGLPQFVDATTVKRLMALGYSESFNGQLWTLSFNTITADGYRQILMDYMILLDNMLTTTVGALTTTGTSVVIKTPVTSRPWINTTDNPTEFPVPILIEGEQISITALTAPSVVGSDNQQTATLTRSVNGIVKAHGAGALVTVNADNYLGL